ncbi:endonuclease [Clostridium oceanicum]|uniref:Endonuclease YhcR N-terminal domain-containing protein n=1 Tax=Clostridium oceanicum TaxID=1543 RepID=A0ABP3UWJ1_9CLOT
MLKINKKICSIVLSTAMLLTFTSFCPVTNTASRNIVQAYSTNVAAHSVKDAIQNTNKEAFTITGYVVGEPINSNSFSSHNFRLNTALVLSDNPYETNPSNCIYIQIPKQYRSSFGLVDNENLLNKKITVSGTLDRYFSHSGLKSVRKMSLGSTGSTDETGNDNSNGSSSNTTNNNGSDNNNTSNTGNDNSNTNTTGSIDSSKYDSAYYKPALGKKGSELKEALHNIIKNNTKLSYKQVWDGIKDTDEDPNNPNNVILLYTGRSQSKNTNGGAVDNWNREHVWAKSHGDFGTRVGPGTDLHHLRATDVSVNSSRGNKDFDMGGSFHKEATKCRFDSDSWEPRDAVKGDVARMIFYMAVRYEGDNGEPDLEVVDNMTSNKAPYMGKLSVLLKWNEQDPVDASEKRRNEIIYSKYQHNRNPFIDHPEMIDSIWKSANN